jgi:hypothetical protein
MPTATTTLPRRTDVRDFALANAAFDHCELQARIADLEGERNVYRDMLRDALASLHDCDRRLRRERQQRLNLAEEFRAFRRRTMARPAA